MSFLGTLKKYSLFIIVSFTLTTFISYATDDKQSLNEKTATAKPDKKKKKKKKKKGIGGVAKKMKKVAKAPVKMANKVIKSTSKLLPEKEKKKEKKKKNVILPAAIPVIAKAMSPQKAEALPQPSSPPPTKVEEAVKAYDPYDQTGLPAITIDPPGPDYDYYPNLPMVLFMPPKGIDAPTLADDKPSPDLQ